MYMRVIIVIVKATMAGIKIMKIVPGILLGLILCLIWHLILSQFHKHVIMLSLPCLQTLHLVAETLNGD